MEDANLGGDLVVSDTLAGEFLWQTSAKCKKGANEEDAIEEFKQVNLIIVGSKSKGRH
jgi:hypothetical protein